MITSKGLESKFKKIAPKYFSDLGFVKTDRDPYSIINKSNFSNMEISYINMIIFPKNVFQYKSIEFCWLLHYPKIEHFWLKYRQMVNKDNYPLTPTIGFLKTHISNEFIDNSKYHEFITNISDLKLSNGAELIENYSDFEEIINRSSEQYKSNILSYIDEKCDLRWLDNVINSSLDFSPLDKNIRTYEGHLFRKIIVAKMVSNPSYNQIVDYHKKRYKSHHEETGNENSLLYYKTLIELDKDLSQYKNPKDFEG